MKSEDSQLYSDIKHFVPNKFWFYLGNDKIYSQFEGWFFRWNLHFGQGSFNIKPQTFIDEWPYDPEPNLDKVISALLANEGMNSVKIKKSAPTSGKFSVDPIP